MCDTPKQIITRAEARELGLPRYFTGKPCKRGHVVERHTITRDCVECKSAYRSENRKEILEKNKAYYNDNRDRLLEQKKAYYNDNRDIILEKQKVYNSENRDSKREYDKDYHSKNREKRLEQRKSYYSENTDKFKAYVAKRRAAKLQRTVEYTDTDKIKVYYNLTEPGLHVDHIIPLQGNIVSGLHVHQNLQIIDGVENLSKHNNITQQELDTIAQQIMNSIKRKGTNNERTANPAS